MISENEIRQAFDLYLQEENLELYDLNLVNYPVISRIEVYVYSSNDINLELTSRLNKQFQRLLENMGIEKGSYDMVVSSPGIERKLKTYRHYELAIGELVKLKMIEPINSVYSFEGVINSVNSDELFLSVDDQIIEVKILNIKKKGFKMKRIIIALLFLSGTITNSFAEVGAKIGITAALGYFETSASEKEDSETSVSRDAEGLGAFGAIFLEKELTDVVSVGVEYTPTAFETEENTHLQSDQKASIVFHDPRPAADVLVPRKKQTTLNNSSLLSYASKQNRAVIFPSWLPHGVDLNMNTEKGEKNWRISVSFNFIQI